MEIPARWWKAHCKVLKYWMNTKKAMKERFGKEVDRPQDEWKYMGDSSPEKHIKDYMTSWESQGIPRNQWVHAFIHTLGTIP